MRHFIVHAVWFAAAFLGVWQQPDAARAQPSTGGSRAELIERALIENDRDAKDAVAALGMPVAGEVESYLAHRDPRVRREALALLWRIPEAAPGALVKALRSSDENLKLGALGCAAPFMTDPGVVGAWSDCFVEPLEQTNGHEVGYNTLVHLPQEVRTAVAGDLVPKIMRSLDTYDGTRSIIMIKIIGQFVPPGDETALRRLPELRRDVEGELAPRLQRRNDDEYNERVRVRLIQVIDFAEGNIGDERAFKRYASAVTVGDPEARAGRLEFLGRFRPVARTLQRASRLLDDRTPLRDIRPSHSPQPFYKRACDFAVDALGEWFTDFPFKTASYRVYVDEELTQAREWLEARLSQAGR